MRAPSANITPRLAEAKLSAQERNPSTRSQTHQPAEHPRQQHRQHKHPPKQMNLPSPEPQISQTTTRSSQRPSPPVHPQGPPSKSPLATYAANSSSSRAQSTQTNTPPALQNNTPRLYRPESTTHTAHSPTRSSERSISSANGTGSTSRRKMPRPSTRWIRRR